MVARAVVVLGASLLIDFSDMATRVAAQTTRPMKVDDVYARRLVGAPAMSPDGRLVAYVLTHRDLDKGQADSDVWLVTVDGGAPTRAAANSDKTDNDPQWAPDGSWLAFRSTRAGRAQIYGTRPDGGEA